MFTRPASPFKQMLARPGSPDRHARSPSRTQSPGQGQSPPKQRWFGSVSSHAGMSQGSVQSRSAMSQVSYAAEYDTFAGQASPAPSLLRPTSALGHRDGHTTGASAAPLSPSSRTLSQAQHVDVVLESEEDAAILPFLGEVVDGSADAGHDNVTVDIATSASGSSIVPVGGTSTTKRTASREEFEARLEELIETERSYVQRLEVLYSRYAQPLRHMARDRDTAIIPAYEAQKLFGNIGELWGANTALLHELESFHRSRSGTEDDAFDLASILYRNMTCMSCYNEYFANFEKAKHIEQTMMRSNKGFRDFVERTKRSARAFGNVGLRELLMEPIQRMPRYILLMQALSNSCASTDPACVRLDQAIHIANRIAKCDVDDQTKRAAVQWSLTRNIQSFPPALINVNRRLIDCIDVDDYVQDANIRPARSPLLSPSVGLTPHATPRALHCALLLFDDVLVIVKRAHSTTCTRSLLGLDDVNALADDMKAYMERSSGPMARTTAPALGFRGHIDLCDLEIFDRGSCDLQLVLSKLPLSVSGEKWATRLVRQYIAVDTKENHTSRTVAVRQDMVRFLESVWQRQALYRAVEGLSHVRCSVAPCSSDKARQITYWSVYNNRHAHDAEQRKSRTALHVNTTKTAEALPLIATETRPSAVVHLRHLDESENTCYITIQARQGPSILDGPPQRWQLEDLADLMWFAAPVKDVQADSVISRPTTPCSRQPSKTLGAGLEQFGRSMFGSPGSIRSSAAGSDIFGLRRALSKGSSHGSRNASVSTRVTYSSANTSSVASRDMLSKSALGSSPEGDTTFSSKIARYRKQESPARHITNAELSSSGAASMLDSNSPSPTRRTPSSVAGSQSRVSSNGSKRGFPPGDFADDHPSKRSALARDVETSGTRPDEAAPPVPSKPPAQSYSGGKENGTPSPSKREDARYAPNAVLPLGTRDDNKTAVTYDDDTSGGAGNETIKEMGSAGRGPSHAIQQVGREAQADLDRLRDAVEKTHIVLKRLSERVNERGRIEVNSCLKELDDAMLVQGRVQSSLAALLAAAIQHKGASARHASLPTAELIKLQRQVAVLTRKCDMLTELEKDGRLENTALHKAFNEELDRMYDDANLGEVEQIASLRTALRQATAERNEARAEIRTLQSELSLEKAQSETWRELLVAHHLL